MNDDTFLMEMKRHEFYFFRGDFGGDGAMQGRRLRWSENSEILSHTNSENTQETGGRS